MEVVTQYQLKTFEELEYGQLVLATFANERVLHGIKAFLPLENGKVDKFITLGPFSNDDEGFPVTYESDALYGRPSWISVQTASSSQVFARRT